jgi:hypothetical protein
MPIRTDQRIQVFEENPRPGVEQWRWFSISRDPQYVATCNPQRGMHQFAPHAVNCACGAYTRPVRVKKET